MIKLFVEGDNDLNFVKTLIEHFGLTQNHYDITPVNGWEKIVFLKNMLQANKDIGGKNYIIFDADGNPPQRRTDISNLIDNPALMDGIFLFPDNGSIGSLETVLIQAMNPTHNAINNCFDTYRNCIHGLNGGYFIPDDKTKVFAYLSVLGKPYSVKQRDYTDIDAWDLNHALINGFVTYLTGILN